MVSPGPRARAFVARPGWPLIYQDFRSVVRQDRGELSNLAFRMQRPWIAAITHRRSGGRWSTTSGTGEGRGLGQRPKLQLPRTEKAGSLFSAIPAPAPSGEQGEQEQYQWGGSLLERDTRERLGGCGHSLEFCFHRCAFPQLRVHQLSFWDLELEDGWWWWCFKSRRLSA